MATNLTDGAGFLWDIQNDGSIGDGTNDAYDGGMYLSGAAYSSTQTLEDAGREVVMGSYTSGQFSIVRKVYVPATGTGFARFLEIVTNTGTTTSTYNLGIDTNLGSDGGESIINTSSGDTTFTTADRWIITDSATDSDPAVAHVFGGAGGITPTSVTGSSHSGGLAYNFDMTLAPGQTRILMHFAVQAATSAGAQSTVNYIQSQPAAIFAGMSSQEMAQVVNYVTGPVINSTYAIATTTDSTKVEGNTGATALTFTVTRTGNTTVAGTVDYAVAGSGSQAASATDFVGNALPTGTVSFAAGQTSRTITINVAGDTNNENNETFSVALQNATSGSVSTTSYQATGTIINDDLNSLTPFDNVYTGTTGADFVSGLSGDDTLTALDGNDVLVGGGGDDVLNGGSGDDLLAGSSGDDTLAGGSGNDVLYAGNAPAWSGADEVQTNSASGVIPSTNQTLAISMTAPTATDTGMVMVEGLVSRSTASNNQFNIVYVIDRSGSMSSPFSGTETVPDMNGDGSANQLMDAAIQSFEAINASLSANGFSSSRLGIVQFDHSASTIYNGTLNIDANNNGRSDASDALRTIQWNGNTDYELALRQAITFFQAAPSGNNVVFFVSDGAPNGGVYTDEVATLLNANGINADIRAIGLGTGASLTDLDLVDDGLANNTAVRANSPSTLTSGLIAPPVNSADIARVEILREGVVVATILPSQLVSTPLGLRYSANISGLNLADNSLVARVVATDTARTTVSTDLHVGTGEFNDFLYGGSGNDTLYGGRGTDLLDGGSATDTASYALNGRAVTVDLSNTGYQNTLGAGLDKLVSIENLLGSAFNDTLTGNSLNNTLNGGAGADQLRGGTGNDTYYVDNTGDLVTEAASAGTDSVSSSISYTLGANVENLTLTGAASINGTGNDLANIITGNTGNNILTGGAGNDTLSGGVGNDTLNGGIGNDTLNGGSGADMFRFVLTSDGTDSIADFQSGADKIQVVSPNFANIPVGILAANRFVASGTSLTNSNAVFIYNSTTGGLSFDRDGNGSAAAVQVATLTGHPTLLATDFQVVAA